MIYLISQNNYVYVWNAEDWKKLRQDHRIVGNLFGCLPRAPFQNNFCGIPSVLLNEEVTLLLDKKLCKLVKYDSLAPSHEIKSGAQAYKENNIKEQEEYIIEEKKRSITSMIDKIVEGKRKKLSVKKTNNGDTPNEVRSETELDKENILRAELERVENTPLTHHLVHIFTEEPWLKEENFKEVNDWQFPCTEVEKLRYKVFKDLWEKGYYVTCGQKFGGDFLVYPGDPALYHAHYIVSCKDDNQPMSWLEIATNCRVSTSARKTLVMASLSQDDHLKYTSVQFESMARCPT